MTINHRTLLAFAIPAIIAAISATLASGTLLQTYPDLARGITYDLTVISPLLYFLLIRKTSIPNITVVPVFVLGLLLAGQIIPLDNQSDLQIISTYVLPIVELAVITAIILKVSEAVKIYRKADRSSRDMFNILRNTSASVLNNRTVGNVLAMELSSIYYSLISWKNSPDHGFSYHRNSGSLAILITVVFVVVVETIVIHLLLVRWSEAAAWILTILSIYTAIQLIGHIKAMIQRPIVVSEGAIELKYGLFGDATIQKSDIEEVEISDVCPESKEGVQKLALLGDLEAHNIIFHLKNPVEVIKAYGITKKASTLLLYADDPAGLKDQLNA